MTLGCGKSIYQAAGEDGVSIPDCSYVSGPEIECRFWKYFTISVFERGIELADCLNPKKKGHKSRTKVVIYGTI
jgi:hypothetical protein